MKLFIRLFLILILLFSGLPSTTSDAMIVRNSRGGVTSVEGTEVLSTGEVGGTKFLREDGDDTSSWQVPAGGGDVTAAANITAGAVVCGDDGAKGVEDCTEISVSSINVPVTVTASASEVTIADVTEMNQVYKISAAVDVNIPTGLCDTATGHWLTVKSNGANVVSIRSLDASNVFELADGTQTTAGDELDTAGADGNLCYVICDEAETWTVYGQIGTCADGGAGD